MQKTDIALYESGSGGDFILLTNDIETTGALWNNIYLALFGGNVESSHEDRELVSTEPNPEYWGNTLFYPEDNTKWMNSRTEIFLTETTLDSKGLAALEEIIKNDLQYLSELGDVTVEVTQLGVDKIEIAIFIQEKETQTELSLRLIWDATLQEIINDQKVGDNVFVKPVVSEALGFDLPFNFGLV